MSETSVKNCKCLNPAVYTVDTSVYHFIHIYIYNIRYNIINIFHKKFKSRHKFVRTNVVFCYFY